MKKQYNLIPTQEERQSRKHPEMTQMLELADKDFKATNLTMLKDVKENMLIMNKKRKSQKIKRTKWKF